MRSLNLGMNPPAGVGGVRPVAPTEQNAQPDWAPVQEPSRHICGHEGQDGQASQGPLLRPGSGPRGR